MADDRGKLIAVDPETVMGLGKRATVIPGRTAVHLRHQEHLVALEARHIYAFEVRRKLRVAENPLNCVALGTGKSLEFETQLAHVIDFGG